MKTIYKFNCFESKVDGEDNHRKIVLVEAESYKDAIRCLKRLGYFGIEDFGKIKVIVAWLFGSYLSPNLTNMKDIDVIKIILGFFVCVLIFSIGMDIGRKIITERAVNQKPVPTYKTNELGEVTITKYEWVPRWLFGDCSWFFNLFVLSSLIWQILKSNPS